MSWFGVFLAASVNETILLALAPTNGWSSVLHYFLLAFFASCAKREWRKA